MYIVYMYVVYNKTWKYKITISKDDIWRTYFKGNDYQINLII